MKNVISVHNVARGDQKNPLYCNCYLGHFFFRVDFFGHTNEGPGNREGLNDGGGRLFSPLFLLFVQPWLRTIPPPLLRLHSFLTLDE